MRKVGRLPVWHGLVLAFLACLAFFQTANAVASFNIASGANSLTFDAGSSTTSTITLQAIGGFSGNVTLSVLVSPVGLACFLTPTAVSLVDSAVSTLYCTGSVPGSFSVTVTGTSGSTVKMTNLTVVVTQPVYVVLFYYMLVALGVGSGAAVLKMFSTTSAPFDEFFTLTGGEFTPPASLLIVGDSGSGTSTLGLELIYRQLSAGRNCGILIYDSFPSEVQRRMNAMGWDVAPYLENGSLKIIDCYSALAGEAKAEVKDPLDFTDLSIRVSDVIERSETGPVTILFDSITAIFNSTQAKHAANFLRVLGAKVKSGGGVLILAATKGAISQEVGLNIEAMVDGVIELSIIRYRNSARRILTVKKIAGHQISSTPLEFRIVNQRGIVFRRPRFAPTSLLRRIRHSIQRL